MPMLIKLELWEINLILKALVERPYKETAPLIRKIKEQAKREEYTCS